MSLHPNNRLNCIEVPTRGDYEDTLEAANKLLEQKEIDTDQIVSVIPTREGHLIIIYKEHLVI